MQEQPNYYALIPANVRYDKNLSSSEKLLYGEITALATKEGYCWASNHYFAELFGVEVRTVRRWLNALHKAGYVEIDLVYGKKEEIIQRKIYISQELPRGDENISTLGQKRPEGRTIMSRGQDNNVLKNNTSINNTRINKDHMSLSPKSDPIPHKKIIEYLNQKTGRRFKTTTKHKGLIKARWNEGNRLEDFKTVIDLKTAEWKDDPKMNKYLRPSTLFSNKFDNYLNEAPTGNNSSYAGIEFGEGENSNESYNGIEF